MSMAQVLATGGIVMVPLFSIVAIALSVARSVFGFELIGGGRAAKDGCRGLSHLAARLHAHHGQGTAGMDALRSLDHIKRGITTESPSIS